MNNPATGTGVPPSETVRPSLYGPGGAATTAEIFSILDALEPPAPKSTWLRRVTTGTMLLAMAAAIAVAASNRYGGYFAPLKSWLEAGFMRRPAAIPVPDAVHQPVAPPAPLVQEPLAATIVNEVAVGEKNNPEPNAGAAEHEVHRAETTPAAAPESRNAVAAGSSGKKVKPASKSAAKNKPEKKKSETRVAAARTSAATPAAAGQSHKDKGTDKDVELIAALLTHMTRPGVAGKDPTPKSGSSAPGTSTAPTAFKRERLQNPDRDVVLRSPGESTEALVKRCQTLGFLEGQLCRIRICSDLWGKDAACPVSTVNSSN